MPGIDGYEIARRIKELKGRDSNKSTPMIMVTGTSDRDAMTRGFAEGIVVFLNKPFSPADFRRTVQSIVGWGSPRAPRGRSALHSGARGPRQRRDRGPEHGTEGTGVGAI